MLTIARYYQKCIYEVLYKEHVLSPFYFWKADGYLVTVFVIYWLFAIYLLL